MRCLYTCATPRKQGGAALLIALILLVVMTLLGLSAMNTVMLETRLATNAREKAYSFQMAETALRENDDLFADEAVMAYLGVDTDRQIWDNDSPASGEQVLATPAYIDRDNAHGIHSEALTGRNVMEYKGSFSVPLGAPGSNWGVGTAEGSYFEILTRARNVQQSLAGNSGEILMTMRAGYRQLAPAESDRKSVV